MKYLSKYEMASNFHISRVQFQCFAKTGMEELGDWLAGLKKTFHKDKLSLQLNREHC